MVECEWFFNFERFEISRIPTFLSLYELVHSRKYNLDQHRVRLREIRNISTVKRLKYSVRHATYHWTSPLLVLFTVWEVWNDIIRFVELHKKNFLSLIFNREHIVKEWSSKWLYCFCWVNHILKESGWLFESLVRIQMNIQKCLRWLEHKLNLLEMKSHFIAFRFSKKIYQ